MSVKFSSAFDLFTLRALLGHHWFYHYYITIREIITDGIGMVQFGANMYDFHMWYMIYDL